MRVGLLIIFLNVLFVLSKPDNKKCPKCKKPGFDQKCKSCGFAVSVVDPGTSSDSSSSTDSEESNGGGDNGGGGGGGNGGGDSLGGNGGDSLQSSPVLLPPISVQSFDYFKNGSIISKYRSCLKYDCNNLTICSLEQPPTIVYTKNTSCKYISKCKFKSAVFMSLYWITETHNISKRVQDSIESIYHLAIRSNCTIEQLIHFTVIHIYFNLIDIPVSRKSTSIYTSRTNKIPVSKQFDSFMKCIDELDQYGMNCFLNVLKKLRIITEYNQLTLRSIIKILNGNFKPSNDLEMNFLRIMNMYFVLSKEIFNFKEDVNK